VGGIRLVNGESKEGERDEKEGVVKTEGSKKGEQEGMKEWLAHTSRISRRSSFVDPKTRSMTSTLHPSSFASVVVAGRDVDPSREQHDDDDCEYRAASAQGRDAADAPAPRHLEEARHLPRRSAVLTSTTAWAIRPPGKRHA
jgi:hypothetical protein